MGMPLRQHDTRHGAYRLVTDSMVLDEHYVADVVEKPDLDAAWVPRVIIGLRNALLMSAVLWAAIIGLIVWLS